MKYQQYIDLGFRRTDMQDSVEFKETGYYGFALEKKLKRGLLICVCSPELDKPKMYIPKIGTETYHIINITCEMVMDLVECLGLRSARTTQNE